ncbi:hypothetical protein H6P81_010423 [Aristolochia fimbriata]|uniref:Uncharacterized protein n=1 Tax=Aristolochia fimbriata TaxID=158543 RepID=A0AAV7ENQ7_ARIFI|nr:hypothetical protein H6P81_010423 [Aristolochia fimbriata]
MIKAEELVKYAPLRNLLADEFERPVNKWFRDWYFATFECADLLYIKDWYYTDLVGREYALFFIPWFFEKMTEHCSQYVSTLEQQWQLNTGAAIKSVFPPKDALTIQGVKGASMAIVHPVETTSTPTTTELLQAINQLVKQGNFANLTLEAVGKQLQQMEGKKQLQQMEGKINQLLAQKAAKPTCSEASTSKQVIKSPLIHPPMKLEMLPEDRTVDLLEKFLEKIGSRQINTLPEKQTYQQSLPSYSQAVNVKQEQSRVIYEWNIDNPTPKKVQDTIHRMLIYSNVCRSRGMTEPIVVNQIVAGLSGDLYGWWYNYLDEPYRNHILYAVKTDASGAPLLDSEDKPISDAVMSLLASIVSNFSWDPSRQTETTKYLLHNIRCRTLTDLNWYITTFRSRVMTLPDAANPYWKQRFIEGLPTQFATKVKEGLRQNPNEEVNWNSLHYGHLQAACTQQGLALCNDLRLKKQLKQDHISAKTLGEFCKQFAFDPVPVNPCGTCAANRPAKPFSQGGEGVVVFPFPKADGRKKNWPKLQAKGLLLQSPGLQARSPVATSVADKATLPETVLRDKSKRLTDQKDKQLLLETVLREHKTESSKHCDNHYTMPALYKRIQKQTASTTPPDLQKEIKVNWEVDTDNNNIPTLWRTYEVQRWINYYATEICHTAVAAIKADLEDWGKIPLPDEVEDITSTGLKELRERYFRKFPSAREAETPARCAKIIQQFFATTFSSHQPVLSASSTGDDRSEGSVRLGETEAEAAAPEDEQEA